MCATDPKHYRTKRYTICLPLCLSVSLPVLLYLLVCLQQPAILHPGQTNADCPQCYYNLHVESASTVSLLCIEAYTCTDRYICPKGIRQPSVASAG